MRMREYQSGPEMREPAMRPQFRSQERSGPRRQSQPRPRETFRFERRIDPPLRGPQGFRDGGPRFERRQSFERPGQFQRRGEFRPGLREFGGPPGFGRGPAPRDYTMRRGPELRGRQQFGYEPPSGPRESFRTGPRNFERFMGPENPRSNRGPSFEREYDGPRRPLPPMERERRSYGQERR
jgi:hypothetical protein